MPYPTYVKYLKWLTLSLFAHVGVMFFVHISWSGVVRATVVPQIQFSKEYLTALAAVLGTTISRADLQANPDHPDVRLKEQLVRFDLLSTRDSFKACLSMYIWKLVTSAKRVRDWIASQPEPSPEEDA